jgi:hypothetical protein
MKFRNGIAGLVAFPLILAAGSAVSAQLYKWVDERGVVTYSNQMPADAKTAGKVTAVADRVSVYTPDAALVRDIEADKRARRAAAEQPAAYQPAVAALSPPAPAPAAPVVSESYAMDYPYWVASGPHRQRPLHPVPQIKLAPGAIAGAMLGTDLLIPGSTSPVPGIRTSALVEPARHRHHGPKHLDEVTK